MEEQAIEYMLKRNIGATHCLSNLTGIGQILPPFTHPDAIPNLSFFCGTQKKVF